ncbi:MAG: hypothetical protein QF561_06890 [Phycisphaerales bacterium]|nr:hypothetical protein [Phycisphaerales bacterium]
MKTSTTMIAATALASCLMPSAGVNAHELTDGSRYPDLVQESTADDAISVYVVPVRGQVGTDILLEVYEPIIEDIKSQSPDMVIIHIDSHDYKDVDDEIQDIMEETGRPDEADSSYPSLKPMAELRKAFAQELPDTHQVAYVEDAMSVASLLALSWEDLYIDPDADLGGAVVVWAWMAAPVVKDSQKYGKYLRAIMGDVQGIVQYAGWDEPDKRNFIQAMVAPEAIATTTWRGRDAIWYGNNKGDFPVDTEHKVDSKMGIQELLGLTINLSGEQAEQLLVADGTAAPDRFVKDILAQMGHRRYRLLGKDASVKVEKHRSKWRAAAKRARDAIRLYGRMEGGAYMYQLQAALRALNTYISAIKTNKAVKTRMQLERLPTDLTQLEMMREDLKEKIRNFNRGGGGAGGGGFGGGGGGGGM